MSSKFKSKDEQFAWKVHNQMNRLDVTGITENAAFPNNDLKENYKPKTLVDKTLEIIDPTPNIHTLFIQFDKRFFGNKLLSVEVKWSHRMTSCAGTCSFNTGSRYCVIALSSPLLKLRPRKDLIETLLHEMIHAYLFITNNNRDRDGHGPEFCKHMKRINKESGTNITIYHTFHEEVKLYQQHWWRCNGSCQNKHPFFGMVRRSMNRAPGPNDFWWKEHQLTCGGQFIKVREPEKTIKDKKIKNNTKKPNIDKWLIPSPDNKSKNKSGSNDLYQPKATGIKNKKPSSKNPLKSGTLGSKTGSSVITVNKWNTNTNSNEKEFKKLGNSTNNVHGFGTGGPGSSSSYSKTSSGKHISSSGTVGGSSTGKSRLLQLFNKTISQSNSKNECSGPNVQCPICNNMILEKIANEHIDACLINKENDNKPLSSSTPKFTPIEKDKRKLSNDKEAIKCPVCSEFISAPSIMDHIDLCLLRQDKGKNSSTVKNINSPVSIKSSETSSPSLLIFEKTPQSPIIIHDSDSELETPNKKRKIHDYFTFNEPKIPKISDKIANCPVCNKEIKVDDMNRHLDYCLTVIGDENDKNEAGPSKREEEEDQGTKPETCLICNEVLNPEIPLTQHLDDCLRNMFNDDDDSSLELSPTEDKGESSLQNNDIIPIESVIEMNDDE